MVRRRRIRPGARKRHALKGRLSDGHLSNELSEGLGMAYDHSLSLPSESRASPLRQNYERSWRAWKARENEQRTALQEKEHYRLFGGEVDDDELRALGILYDSIYDAPSASGASVPLLDQDFPPLPRPSSIKPSRRPEFRLDLPHFLSSYLSDDSQILRLMSYQSSTSFSGPHKRAEFPSPSPATTSISPQSLLPATQFPVPLRIIPMRANSIPDDADATWTLISSAASTPTSDSSPEAWVFLDDDS